MTTTLNCPYCTKEIDIMTIQMDKDLKYVFEALPSFGTRYSHLVMGYCQLFGVTPFHIKAKKLRIILEEMKKLFDAQAFSYQKKTYAISHAGIGEALDICVKKDFGQHLENHNYLKKIMIGISEREGKDKSKTTEKDLRARESKSLGGFGFSTEETPVGFRCRCDEKPSALSDEQVKANLTRVGVIIKSIGGK
jgi:hypothetical protein